MWFYLCFPMPPCLVTLRYHPTAATNRVDHSAAATMLWSMSTDMCGPRSPHKYRIRVTYSAVAIWKELLGVVAKPFYTGQEVLVQEISPKLQVRTRSSDSCRQTQGEFVRMGVGLKSFTHIANVAKRLGVPSTQARRAVRTGDRVIATLSVAVVDGILFA